MATNRTMRFISFVFVPQVRKMELDRELSRWLRTLALIRRKDGDVVDTSQVPIFSTFLPPWKPTMSSLLIERSCSHLRNRVTLTD